MSKSVVNKFVKAELKKAYAGLVQRNNTLKTDQFLKGRISALEEVAKQLRRI